MNRIPGMEADKETIKAVITIEYDFFGENIKITTKRDLIELKKSGRRDEEEKT